MTKKIVIYYFPAGMRYGSWLLLAASVFLIWDQNYLWSVLPLLLFLIIQTTRYITELDPQRRVCTDYVFFLWMKPGFEQRQYRSLQGITISRNSETTHVRSRIQDRQFNWTAWTATLHFDDGQTLDLLTSASYEAVKREAAVYAEFLGTMVIKS